jgi:hypothetical protein
MRRDVLGLMIPMTVASFGALALGLALGWSDGALGWAIIGAACTAEGAWILLTHRRRSGTR